MIDNVILKNDTKGDITDSVYILYKASKYILNDYLEHGYELVDCITKDEMKSFDRRSYFVRLFYKPILLRWGKSFYEKDVMQKVNELSVFSDYDIHQISSTFEYNVISYKLVDWTEYLEKKKYTSKHMKRSAKRHIEEYKSLLNKSNIADVGDKFTPWLRQLKEEGYFWTLEIAANARVIEEQKKAKWIDQKKQEIRDRGKAIGATLFEVNGAIFNMITVKGGGQYLEYASSGKKRFTYSYMIGETEVTNELWNAVMGDKATKAPQHPAMATREQWKEFIQKLNSLTGKKFRMPKQAEWTYAAQGGDKSQGFKYSGSNNRDEVAWSSVNADGIKDVATKKPNELGIYDMSGNAWEIVAEYLNSATGGAFPYRNYRSDVCVVNPHKSFGINTNDYTGLRLVLPVGCRLQLRARPHNGSNPLRRSTLVL